MFNVSFADSPDESHDAGYLNSNQVPFLSEKAIVNDIRFRKLIEHSYEGITLIDREFNLIYRSKSAERISGWNFAERVKHKMEDLIHPDDWHLLNKSFHDLLFYPSTTLTHVARFLHYAGHYIWMECLFTNLLNDPEVGAIVCNFRDVTERYKANEIMVQTVGELFAYKYAIDESAIVAITNQQGIIEHVNDKFCKISKYNRDELIGHDHRIINSAYHNKAFIKNIWTTIANGEVWKGEIKNKAKDGTFYWVDTTIVPFINEHGKPYQYVAIRWDVTERKINEEKIIQSEHFIKTITDNMPAMIAYWSADLKCLFANKPYYEWFGKTGTEIIGMYKFDLIDKHEFHDYKRYLDNVQRGEPQRFERTFIKPNGEKMFTDTQYLPDFTAEGEVKGFFSLIYDVTEVKDVQNQVLLKSELIAELLDYINDGFVSFDENWRYIYANKQIGKMLHVDEKELIGKNVWEVFPEAIGGGSYQAMQKAFINRIYVSNEDYFAPIDLWHENRIYPSGKGISMFTRDISDRKRADLEIKKHHERLSAITMATNDALFEWDFVTNEIWRNEHHFALFGFDPDFSEPARDEYLSRMDQHSRERFNDFNRELEQGIVSSWEFEVNIMRPGKSTSIQLFRSFVIRDAEGKASKLVGSYTDITHRKNEEKQRISLANAVNDALRERNSILESIGDVFFAVDKHWIVTYWNSIAEKVFKKSKHQVLNKDLWEIYPDEDISEPQKRFIYRSY